MESCRRRVKEVVMVFGVTAMDGNAPTSPSPPSPSSPGGWLQQPDTGIVQEELVGVRTFLLRATLINQLIATGSLLPSLCLNVFHSPYSLTHFQTSNAMFEAPPNNAYGAKFYETAAVSPALFGGDSEWLGEGCGKCWKVTGTANLGSYDSATMSTLVLKGANLCPSENEACSGEKVHFDIAAPGFDVSEFSFAQDCGALDPAEIDGYLGCGRWMIKDQDPTANCQRVQ